MVTQGDQGTFVFVSSREEPDSATAADAYAAAREREMDYASRLAGNIALREEIEEAKLAGGVTRPGDVQ
jgi:hypothetical protein